MRLCSGCGTKLPEETRGRCAECQAERRPKTDDGIKAHVSPNSPSRDIYAELYASPDWRKCSKLQRIRFPFCERCERKLATLCDHLIPAVQFVEWCRTRVKFLIPTQAFFWYGNHQSLCDSCHRLKTLEDEKNIAAGGPWPDLWANPIRPPKKYV